MNSPRPSSGSLLEWRGTPDRPKSWLGVTIFLDTRRDSVELGISSNLLKPERCLGKKDVRMEKTVFSLYFGFADEKY